MHAYWIYLPEGGVQEMKPRKSTISKTGKGIGQADCRNYKSSQNPDCFTRKTSSGRPITL